MIIIRIYVRDHVMSIAMLPAPPLRSPVHREHEVRGPQERRCHSARRSDPLCGFWRGATHAAVLA